MLVSGYSWVMQKDFQRDLLGRLPIELRNRLCIFRYILDSNCVCMYEADHKYVDTSRCSNSLSNGSLTVPVLAALIISVPVMFPRCSASYFFWFQVSLQKGLTSRDWGRREK